MPEQSNIRGIAFVYVFKTRNKGRWIERGWIREIDPPYRWGQGVRIRLSRSRWLELGLCRRRSFDNPYEAVREDLGGRDLAVPPKTIGDWN